MSTSRSVPDLGALLDPPTAAALDPEQIGNLVDDLLAAHGEWVPSME